MAPRHPTRPLALPTTLPGKLAPVFARENLLGETIAWAVPCVSGRGRRIPANLFGALVATNEEPHKLSFVARKTGRPFAQTIDLEGSMVAHEPKFLSENLIIFPQREKDRNIFSFFLAPVRPSSSKSPKISRTPHRACYSGIGNPPGTTPA